MSDQYQKSCRQKNLGKQIVSLSAGYICKQMGESLAKIDKMYSIPLYVFMLLWCDNQQQPHPTPPTQFLFNYMIVLESCSYRTPYYLIKWVLIQLDKSTNAKSTYLYINYVKSKRLQQCCIIYTVCKLITCDLLISYFALLNTVILPFPIKVSLPLYAISLHIKYVCQLVQN